MDNMRGFVGHQVQIVLRLAFAEPDIALVSESAGIQGGGGFPGCRAFVYTDPAEVGTHTRLENPAHVRPQRCSFALGGDSMAGGCIHIARCFALHHVGGIRRRHRFSIDGGRTGGPPRRLLFHLAGLRLALLRGRLRHRLAGRLLHVAMYRGFFAAGFDGAMDRRPFSSFFLLMDIGHLAPQRVIIGVGKAGDRESGNPGGGVDRAGSDMLSGALGLFLGCVAGRAHLDGALHLASGKCRHRAGRRRNVSLRRPWRALTAGAFLIA
ncbi:MAG: hypothetical protein ABSG62_14525 [Terracidiphilus sp.]